jgi:hypothetical protein
MSRGRAAAGACNLLRSKGGTRTPEGIGAALPPGAHETSPMNRENWEDWENSGGCGASRTQPQAVGGILRCWVLGVGCWG